MILVRIVHNRNAELVEVEHRVSRNVLFPRCRALHGDDERICKRAWSIGVYDKYAVLHTAILPAFQIKGYGILPRNAVRGKCRRFAAQCTQIKIIDVEQPRLRQRKISADRQFVEMIGKGVIRSFVPVCP